MIGRLKGRLIEKKPPVVLLDVGGVGYEIHMPMTCFYQLAEPGEEAIIITHFVVREDAQQLYGFISSQERNVFRELIKVSGVGPKLALAVLSGMSAGQFIHAVHLGDAAALVRLPGIGKKTAERLVIEMRDRLQDAHSDLPAATAASATVSVPNNNEIQAEAVTALVALGYKPQEASRMISNIANTAHHSSEALIRDALRAAL